MHWKKERTPEALPGSGEGSAGWPHYVHRCGAPKGLAINAARGYSGHDGRQEQAIFSGTVYGVHDVRINPVEAWVLAVLSFYSPGMKRRFFSGTGDDYFGNQRVDAQVRQAASDVAGSWRCLWTSQANAKTLLSKCCW